MSLDRFQGCLIGLASGDALGTTNEFLPKGIIEAGIKPFITDIVGGGPFYLKPGQWTDDTSMALCLAMSLIEKNGFDAKDQMDKYLNWVDNGYMSSNGKCFDIGTTTSESLERYKKTGNPFAGLNDSNTSGNGSLMRLAPIPMFYSDITECSRMASEMSRTTHGSEECKDSCRVLSVYIRRALNGLSKDKILNCDEKFVNNPAVDSIANGSYKTKTEKQIRASGFVLHTLEAALWAFFTTDNFKDGAIKAVDLCEDADTTGAVYGQLAGAHYGLSGIPPEWVNKITYARDICTIAQKLMR